MNQLSTRIDETYISPNEGANPHHCRTLMLECSMVLPQRGCPCTVAVQLCNRSSWKTKNTFIWIRLYNQLFSFLSLSLFFLEYNIHSGSHNAKKMYYCISFLLGTVLIIPHSEFVGFSKKSLYISCPMEAVELRSLQSTCCLKTKKQKIETFLLFLDFFAALI